MPRPARPWFRFYSEALENRKLMSLPAPLFKSYVSLLMVANRSDPRGTLPPPWDVAYLLHTEVEPLMEEMKELKRLRFLDGGWRDYRIHDWQDWQPDSDAQLTPGRRGRNADRTPLERDK